jgi:hypothetical protein
MANYSERTRHYRAYVEPRQEHIAYFALWCPVLGHRDCSARESLRAEWPMPEGAIILARRYTANTVFTDAVYWSTLHDFWAF